MCLALVSFVGFIFDLLAFLACGVAFLAPHWIYYPPGVLDHAAAGIEKVFSAIGGSSGLAQISYEYDGLLGRCMAGSNTGDAQDIKDKCKWFWHNDFEMEKDLPDWHKAAQALYSFGYVILLSTVLLSLLHLCCRCCCHKAFSLATIIGSLILAGFLLIAASVAVYGVYQHLDNNVQLDASGKGQFYWAIYVSAGGLVFSLLAAILFICDGCRRQRPYDGYETARMI